MKNFKVWASYFWAVVAHKWWVFTACGIVGGIPLWRMIIHDWSKFSPSEFFPYANRFNGPNTITKEEWDAAWQHHIDRNPHHWNYWLTPGASEMRKLAVMEALRIGHLLPSEPDVPVEMPEKFLREMVADWLGANRSWQGQWDMTEWIHANWWSVNLHPVTRHRIKRILIKLGPEFCLRIHELKGPDKEQISL